MLLLRFGASRPPPAASVCTSCASIRICSFFLLSVNSLLFINKLISFDFNLEMLAMVACAVCVCALNYYELTASIYHAPKKKLSSLRRSSQRSAVVETNKKKRKIKNQLKNYYHQHSAYGVRHCQQRISALAPKCSMRWKPKEIKTNSGKSTKTKCALQIQ